MKRKESLLVPSPFQMTHPDFSTEYSSGRMENAESADSATSMTELSEKSTYILNYLKRYGA